MGTYDISRNAFNPKKRYTSVRMQQGRVLTDDDWNENERIGDEDIRRSRVDIIGPYGSPDDGFKIDSFVQPTTITPLNISAFDFSLDVGVLYLGGLRLECPGFTYRLQPDWLEQPVKAYTAPATTHLTNNTRSDLVYLEAWQQPVCAIEDGELFEAALGGPDTTTRVRNMTRVKIFTGLTDNTCADAWTQLQSRWQTDLLGTVGPTYERVPDATLQVICNDGGAPENLCTPTVAGGYLGAENQAIRVQLRANKTFTWGFDDGSPLYRVTVPSNGSSTTVTMITLPKDQYHWPLSGQVVEILPWSAVLANGEKLAGVEGFITTVGTTPYDPGTMQFSLTTALPANFGGNWTNRADQATLPAPEAGPYLYMRVWNRGTDITSLPEILFTPSTTAAAAPVALGNTGLSVQLYGTEFVAGDHWIIAARPDTPDQVVPWALELQNGVPRMGIRRFFAPLGIIQWTNTGGVISGAIIHDCRKTFRPLTEQECCCTFTVGDGITSFGDFTAIEDAIAALPTAGGKICVLAGQHQANAVISGLSNVEICGCGAASKVVPRAANLTQPIFQIISSQSIEICSLSLMSQTGTAITVVNDANNDPTDGIVIRDNDITAGVYAITIDIGSNPAGNSGTCIQDNRIGMLDQAGGMPAIFVLADDVLIGHNRIVVVPAPDPNDPNDNRGTTDPTGGLFNPCGAAASLYKTPGLWAPIMKNIATYVKYYLPPTGYVKTYTTPGGIQIGSTSERVKIIGNFIVGGSGNGITLGHLFTKADNDPASLTHYFVVSSYNDAGAPTQEYLNTNLNDTLYDIEILENNITKMGLSGIGVPGVFSMANIGVMYTVKGLLIARNLITECVQQPQAILQQQAYINITNEVGFGGIVLASCAQTIIRENQITGNGLNNEYPICGICVRYVEEIEISNNRILNNGVISSTSEKEMATGVVGGIVIQMAFQSPNTGNISDAAAPGFDGTPAAIIRENIVDQPSGNALSLIAIGPVAVDGNQFTSRGLGNTKAATRLIGAVFILNLGIAGDRLPSLVLSTGSFSGLNNISPTSGAVVATDSKGLNTYLANYDYFPNGNILFVDNQVTLDLRVQTKELFLCSQLVATLDDIGYLNNQSACIGFTATEQTTTDGSILDGFLLGVTIRGNNNRFSEGLSLTQVSLLAVGTACTVAFNQATHCVLVVGEKVIPADIAGNNIIFSNTDTCTTLQTDLKRAFNAASTNDTSTAGQIATSLGDIDTQRASQLGTLQSLQTVTSASEVKEQKRLTVKYGATDSTVVDLNARIALQPKINTSLGQETTRLQVKTPAFDGTAWQLSGRVFEADGKAAGDVAVFLTDDGKHAVEGIDYSWTTALGAYVINVPATSIAGLKDKYKTLRLAVSDANQKILYVGKDTLTPTGATVTNTYIYIEGEIRTPPPSVNVNL